MFELKRIVLLGAVVFAAAACGGIPEVDGVDEAQQAQQKDPRLPVCESRKDVSDTYKSDCLARGGFVKCLGGEPWCCKLKLDDKGVLRSICYSDPKTMPDRLEPGDPDEPVAPPPAVGPGDRIGP